MTEQTPYEQLGVAEDASFDEIQQARVQLIELCGDDRQRMARVESAYDAVLMHRLRLRQEGKIRVPDRIRFAEQTPDPPLKPEALPRSIPAPTWFQDFLDTPSSNDILWPALILGGLVSVVLLVPGLSSSTLSMFLVLALGTSSYFLNRKENRLGRSVLLSLAGVILSSVVGYGIMRVFLMPLIGQGLSPEQFVTGFSFMGLWFTCSFLR